MLFKFLRESYKEPYELALVRWYDIDLTEHEKYGCPQLYYTEEYNAIPIGSINQGVHIVPRFDKENRFLLRSDPPMIGSKLLYKFGGKLLLEKCDWSKCCELKNGK